MKIAVTGGNGFTGRFVCKELLKRRKKFIAILRPGTDASWMKDKQIPVRFADLNQTEKLSIELADCSTVLNIASIGFGSAPSLISACESAGIKRAVFVSTTAIFTQLNAASKAIRESAELTISGSSLESTILRPTMIYGTPDDRNMIRLIRWLKKFPFLPIFGDGRSLQQPVHVEDVAWAIVQSAETPATIGHQFNIAGASPNSYNEIVRLTSQALGRNIKCIYLPKDTTITVLKFLEKLGIKVPVTSEQVQRLNENKDFSNAEAHKLIGFNPINFKEGIKREVNLFLSGVKIP